MDVVDERRGEGKVVARADPDLIPLLRMVFGNQLSTGGIAGDGRIELEIAGLSVDSGGGQPAGFGSRMEVIEPIGIRERLAVLGAQLTPLRLAGRDRLGVVAPNSRATVPLAEQWSSGDRIAAVSSKRPVGAGHARCANVGQPCTLR